MTYTNNNNNNNGINFIDTNIPKVLNLSELALDHLWADLLEITDIEGTTLLKSVLRELGQVTVHISPDTVIPISNLSLIEGADLEYIVLKIIFSIMEHHLDNDTKSILSISKVFSKLEHLYKINVDDPSSYIVSSRTKGYGFQL